MDDDRNDTYVNFAEFHANPATGELLRHNEPVLIQRKPFRILQLLINADGALVTREQIIKDLWPDVHVDQQHCLNTAVRKLRTALQDDARTPRIIETVGSRGYRLLLPVQFPAPKVNTVATSSALTLAVLPFKNLSDAEQDFFSDGLTEQMIAQLGRTCRNLSVIAPISSMHYRNTSKEAPQVGQELRSDYLLLGSVLKGDQRFRITARLIRAKDQVCVWSDSYARNDADIFLVQDDIAQQIARSIARTLPVMQAQSANLTTSPLIYETFLKAGFYMNKGDEPAFAKAVELYGQVIAQDPNFAPAYTALAVLFTAVGQYGMMPPKAIYDRVDELTSQAMLLSPALPETMACVGFAKFFYHAEFAASESAFLRALELNQSCVAAHQGYGMLLSAMTRYEESIAAMQHARDLDPFSPMANALVATALCVSGRLHEAVRQARNTIELEPNFPTGYACLGWAQSLMGEHEAAIEAYQAAVKYAPQSSLMLAHLAHGFACAGQVGDCHKLVAELLRMRNTGAWASPYWISLIHTALGDKDSALQWFKVAVEESDGWRVFAKGDARFSAASTDPRFSPYLENIGIAPRQQSSAARAAD